MIPAKQFDLCPWNELIALPHMGWQHAGWFASYVVNATNILEWGCGGSTLWMAMMNTRAKMLAVEDDPHWIVAVCEAITALQDSRCEMNATVIVSAGGGKGRGYTHTVTIEEMQPYDLIFVDGQERPACLAASYDLLTLGGVVFLHDSQRTEYIDAKRRLLEREGMTLIDERLDESWVNPIAGMWAAQKGG